MPIDVILVSLAALTGLIWGADAWLQRNRRASGALERASEPTLVEYARTFFPVIVVVLIIRSFLYEPFRIPSDSMMPTLLDGDFIFVNKFVYGLRLPVTNSKVVELGEPERGDVVVFRLPSNPQTNFIKRVIGLPGDVIEYTGKQVIINGEPMPREIVGVYEGYSRNLPSGGGRPRVAEEQLAGVEHGILLYPYARGREGRYEVPEGHYFLMGDNRDNSHDSRFPDVSYIPEGNLVGKAVRIWMNWDLPHAAPIWNRIGDRIH